MSGTVRHKYEAADVSSSVKPDEIWCKFCNCTLAEHEKLWSGTVAELSKKPDPYKQYYAQLLAKTVVGIVVMEEKINGRAVYGLKFDEGSIAWIMGVEEGNGPGFLDITPGR